MQRSWLFIDRSRAPSSERLEAINPEASVHKVAEAELAAMHLHTRQVLERITDGFYTLDRDWRLTDLNAAAERIVGRNREELLGKNLWEEFPPLVETPLYAACQQALTERVTISLELFYPPLDGWYEGWIYPSPDGLSVFFRDVTEQKRAYQEVRAALAAAEAADCATRQFLDLMSHELRTPMQAVLGYADLLLAEPESSLTLEQVEDIRSIRQGAERMVALVTQIFDLTRLQAGQLELVVKPVDLAEIITQVRQEVAPEAASKALNLRIELPADRLVVHADPERLRQILLNLVGNAVKFTEQGWVRISTEATDDEIAVAVSDTGIGIAEEVLPQIFEPFRQGDSGTTRRFGGAGLGLAIAAKLAEQHAGAITVVSRPRFGSTFTLHLPYGQAISGNTTSKTSYVADERTSGASPLH